MSLNINDTPFPLYTLSLYLRNLSEIWINVTSIHSSINDVASENVSSNLGIVHFLTWISPHIWLKALPVMEIPSNIHMNLGKLEKSNSQYEMLLTVLYGRNSAYFIIGLSISSLPHPRPQKVENILQYAKL